MIIVPLSMGGYESNFSKAVIMRLATEGSSQSTDSFTTRVPLEMFHATQLLSKQESNAFDYLMKEYSGQ